MKYPKQIELHPINTEEALGYVLRCFDEYKSLENLVQVNILSLDNHYVLKEYFCDCRFERKRAHATMVTVLGVSHDFDDADKRAYTHLKEKAEEMARIHNITDLVDNTKHAPEKLPKGGK